ncbi:MAG: imidazole glycerol phosphate synthase subunit HisH [Phycisphaerae bacterium]|nr:imidazole glycerol phosphate synthase subunit HisH [Phycisphaerae bacterium]
MSATPPEIVIARTGCANLASVAAAFARLGVPTRLSDRPDEIVAATGVVLPGVGNFGPAMTLLRERGLDVAILERTRRDRPLLAICLGMQMLCDHSEESPGVPGLGVIRGRVCRFAPGLRVPQMGWNRIAPNESSLMIEPASVYFANSFRLGAIPQGWGGAIGEYGGPFAAAIERGPVLACQFHPELSGAAGLRLLKRWVVTAVCGEALPC